MKVLLIISLVLGSLPGYLSGQVPSAPGHPGILLFQQGRFSDAILSLEVASKSAQHKKDAEIWNYLGLAYLGIGDNKKSRKPLEKSVDLNPSDSAFRSNLAYSYLLNHQLKKAREQADRAIALDSRNPTSYQVLATANLWDNKLDLADGQATTFIDLDPSNPGAYILRANILVVSFGARVKAGSSMRDEVSFLAKAVQVLQSGVAKTKGSTKSKELEEELESTSAFYEHLSKLPAPRVTAGPEPGVEPLKMLARPRANYTDQARAALVKGTIRVVLLLGASKRIEYVLFISRLGYGLDQEVLKAVKEIRFEPKKVNGKPVSSVVTLEYSFDIY